MAVGFSAISIKSALVAGTLLALGAQSTASAEKYASIVIDLETDQVLHARHADAPRYPASLTKAMTLYMLFDAMKSGEVKLYERLPVSRAAASQPPSSLRLRAGSTITTKDAINALITKSANDVAVVVAERLGGTEQRFATLMTAKAEAMGMESTTFKNASGLPNSQQLSTARDMSILAERLLEDHADYYGYFANTKFSWGRANYRNHNKLIGKVSGVDGIKTGYTRASGFNLMASAKRRGRRVVAIMFGGSTARSRDQHVSDLIEAAYKSFEQGDEAPELRMRMTFSDIQPPIDPDAAAMPVLNGRIFGASAIVAEGDEGSKPE
ncbi:MAG: D-alanyl-D-alanine carboxypeptidase [Hyphomonas sp.]|nr:D-alanyl-D-alanine carboxypeptidase [Hyphomonas sp.]